MLRVRIAVYFSLAIPHEIFKSPVPESVLTRLQPGPRKTKLVRAWLRRVGLLNPDEKKFGRVGYVIFTALLYDDLSGLVRALAPDPAWMKARHGLPRRCACSAAAMFSAMTLCASLAPAIA